MKKTLEKFYKDYTNSLNAITKNPDFKILNKAFNLIENAIINKKKIFVCGNGGSGAISNHFMTDFFKCAREKTIIKPIVLSLFSNSELISAISNDMDFKKIFSYQIETLGNKGDLAILYSVSGNSKNIIEAAKICKKKKISVVAFSGFQKNKLLKVANVNINFNNNNFGIVEDLFQIHMHIFSQYITNKYKI
jgi:D-sedoheptulose 7-phosphate isomerase